jgi:hypothetical protein
MIQHLKRPKKRLPLAIGLMVCGSFILAIQAACVKIASDDLSTNFLTFARSFVNLFTNEEGIFSLLSWEQTLDHLLDREK